MSEIPGLSHSADKENTRHSFQRPKCNNVLRPTHPHRFKRHRESSILVNLRKPLHQTKGHRQHAVQKRRAHHRPYQPHRNIPARVLRLLRHRRNRVEPHVREEQHRRRLQVGMDQIHQLNYSKTSSTEVDNESTNQTDFKLCK